MYEISLVPDVKGELIRKQKLRNFILLLCVVVAGGCAAVLLVMVSITGGQGIALNGLDEEIDCRYTGEHNGKSDSCSKYSGTPIRQFSNLQDILTIQDQMNKVNILNDNKVKMSRLFGVLDVILPNAEDRVKVTELSMNVAESSMYISSVAYSDNGVNYRALDAFEKGIKKTYFDYGDYMRQDSSGEWVKIPSFCIDEEMQDTSGYIYAIYHKGNPGCEAPLVEVASDNVKDTEEDEKKEEEKVEIEKKDIKIRRTYRNSEDKNSYMNGEDTVKSLDYVKGYYFESEFITYDEHGIDEESSLEKCPVLGGDLYVSDPSLGLDSDDNLRLAFEANIPITRDIFLAKNHNMQIISPTRQNVTDSYIQIRDMFTKELEYTETK